MLVMKKLKCSYKGIFSKQRIFMNEMDKYEGYEIGDWTYGNPEIKTFTGDECTTLRIGRFCSFAGGVSILLGGEHNIHWITTYPFSVLHEKARHIKGHPKSKGDIVIGNDVWVGQDALILSGVHIGNGAVIGARSVVTKNIQPYSLVAGNPARHIRYRFSEPDIEEMERIAWWNWPIEKIEAEFELLLSANIHEFIKRHTI